MVGNSNYLFNLHYLKTENVKNEVAESMSNKNTGRMFSSGIRSLDDHLDKVCLKFPECHGFIFATLDQEPYKSSFRFFMPVFFTGSDYSAMQNMPKGTDTAARMKELEAMMKNYACRLGKQMNKIVQIYNMQEFGRSFDNDLLIGKITFERFGLDYSNYHDLIRNLAIYFLREELCAGYDVKSSFFYPAKGRQRQIIASAFALCDELKSAVVSASPVKHNMDGMGIFRAAERVSYFILADRTK